MTNFINLTQFEQNPQFGSITNPRIFNFSQIPKLIKLTNIYHEYNNIETKPNDQFQKTWLETSKTPNMNSSENTQCNA